LEGDEKREDCMTRGMVVEQQRCYRRLQLVERCVYQQ
jgi:hypothetical protein